MGARDYQLWLEEASFAAWREPNVFNLMPVLATGGGKTFTFCRVLLRFDRPAAVIAHRQELVSQAALALNREKVPHAIIAPKALINEIVQAEHRIHGWSTYSPKSYIRVAGVDTIIRRDAKDRWFKNVGIVVIDEGHHVQAENKWGVAMSMFPSAYGYFPTAQAVRGDNNGLGRGHGGLVDRLIVGPHNRALINRGFLCDYRLVCAESDLDFSDVDVGPSGEFNQPKLRAATHRSKKLVGDVVDHYLRFTPGELGITFAVDVESAKDIATAYQKKDIPAAVITANTPLLVRAGFMERFRDKKLLELISVDCLGEGVDVPAAKVISMARRTASWQNYCQQAGRGGRVMVASNLAERWGQYTDQQRLEFIASSEKPHFTLIDHVGNVAYHWEARGTLFDGRQSYFLTKPERSSRTRKDDDVIPLRYCLNPVCCHPFERYLRRCPRCGMEVPQIGRGGPSQVDGDLGLVDPEILRQMQRERDAIDGPCYMPSQLSSEAQRGLLRNHHDRARAQQSLRSVLALWGGWREREGETIDESQRRFWYQFGTDVLTAQSLGSKEANELEQRVKRSLERAGVPLNAA